MLKIITIVAFCASTAIVGQASTLIYTTDVFSPGESTPTFGTGTVALTNSQLITDAQGATLYDTTAAAVSTFAVLPQFDDNGGTLILDSVQIVMGWATVGTVNIINDSGATANYTNATSSVDITLTPPVPFGALPVTALASVGSGSVGGGTLHTTGQGQTACINSGHIWNGTQCIFYTANAAVVSTPASYGVDQSSPLTTSLANFLGGGNFTIDVLLGQGQYSGTGDASLSFGPGTTSAGGVLEVIYNYHEAPTATPEPSTIVLIGGALAGVSLLRRRKSTVQS